MSDNYKQLASQLHQGLKQYWGAFGEVAEKAGISRGQLHKILRGQHRNMDVLEVASQVLLEKNRDRTERLQSIEKSLKEG